MGVKDKKRGRPAGNTSQLSQDAIITQAKALMLEDGKIPSIRNLAKVLSVDAMAIYYYFKNKDALLEAITTSLISGIYSPKSTDNWQLELEKLCYSYLGLLNQYSGLLETMLSMKVTGPAKIFSERFNVILSPLELDDVAFSNALNLLVDYLHGYALAMRCNTNRDELNIDMIKGPLELLCNAIALDNSISK